MPYYVTQRLVPVSQGVSTEDGVSEQIKVFGTLHYHGYSASGGVTMNWLPHLIPSTWTSQGLVVVMPADPINQKPNYLLFEIGNWNRIKSEPGLVWVDQVPNCIMDFLYHQQQVSWPDLETLETILGSEYWSKLLPHQRYGVRFALRFSRAYIADEPGLGKSITGIMLMKYHLSNQSLLPPPPELKRIQKSSIGLLIVPSGLRKNWMHELATWYPEAKIHNLSSVALFKTFLNQSSPIDSSSIELLMLSTTLVHHPMILPELMKMSLKCMIVDEAHTVKSMTAERSSAVLKLSKWIPYVYLMSGTPFSYPEEMFQPLRILYPKLLPTFFWYTPQYKRKDVTYFAERYCVPTPQHFGKRTTWSFHGYRNSEEFYALLSTLMLRRKKILVLKDLPDKQRYYVRMEQCMTEKQCNEIKLLLSSEKKSNVDFMKAFRLTAQYKVPSILKWLTTHILPSLQEHSSKKFLFFHYHQVVRQAVQAWLDEHSITSFQIVGGTSDQDRKTYCHAFQTTNQYQVGLLSILSAGYGLTLTAAHEAIFLECWFGSNEQLQAEDRCHRIGQTQDVKIYYLIQPRSTDEMIGALVKRKVKESSKMIDGKVHEMTFMNPSSKLGAHSSSNTRPLICSSSVVENSKADLPLPLTIDLDTNIKSLHSTEKNSDNEHVRLADNPST